MNNMHISCNKIKNISFFTSHDNNAVARVRAQLEDRTPMDVDLFWRDVENAGTPLATEIGDRTKECEVTFLWRSAKPLQGVYLRLNRVTDKSYVEKGLMTALPSSDIWMLTLQLPITYRGSYSVVEIPQGTSATQISQLGGRFSPFVGKADPLNKTSGINVRGTKESVLALSLAPAQSEWSYPQDLAEGVTSTSYSFVAGQKRRVRCYLPEVVESKPMGLLVLPDAEIWFDHVGVLNALNIAVKNGRISPMAVLGIDNRDESDRAEILGGRSELVLDIARHLVPQLRANHSDTVWAGRSHTVLAGQSLGGVTAFMTALYAPDIFGTVLSHSPSMWWNPERKIPVMFTENDTSWVSEQILSAPPKDVRIRLCVGSLEGAMVPHVQHLHQRLSAAGVKSDLSIYTGGHDYAWWRGALIDGLTGL